MSWFIDDGIWLENIAILSAKGVFLGVFLLLGVFCGVLVEMKV